MKEVLGIYIYVGILFVLIVFEFFIVEIVFFGLVFFYGIFVVLVLFEVFGLVRVWLFGVGICCLVIGGGIKKFVMDFLDFDEMEYCGEYWNYYIVVFD